MSIEGIYGMNVRGILAVRLLGKVEIVLQMMRKITEQVLYRCDKTFVNSSSDSGGFSTHHTR